MIPKEFRNASSENDKAGYYHYVDEKSETQIAQDKKNKIQFRFFKNIYLLNKWAVNTVLGTDTDGTDLLSSSHFKGTKKINTGHR